MTDGAARLLSRHLNTDGERRTIFRDAYSRLTSRDPSKAWTSGQWMTERTGGSDVRGTETVATLLEDAPKDQTDVNGLALGPYSISGFKWFSSATDSNMSVMLAQTTKGLSVFMAPMRRSSKGTSSRATSELNGISIQRLKPKMGTKPVPTAELVLDGTRGWMIGAEETGVREIATVLNITRVYTGLGSLGYWGRGLSIARAFARVRKVDGGKRLADMPAHLKTMATNTTNYAAMMHLGFFVIMLLGISEQPDAFSSGKFGRANDLVADVAEATALLRLLTAVMKAQCSKMAIYGLQECMEALGGVGYLEDEQEYNIARLYRDCNVNAIWEGTYPVHHNRPTGVMKPNIPPRTYISAQLAPSIILNTKPTMMLTPSHRHNRRHGLGRSPRRQRPPRPPNPRRAQILGQQTNIQMGRHVVVKHRHHRKPPRALAPRRVHGQGRG